MRDTRGFVFKPSVYLSEHVSGGYLEFLNANWFFLFFQVKRLIFFPSYTAETVTNYV